MALPASSSPVHRIRRKQLHHQLLIAVSIDTLIASSMLFILHLISSSRGTVHGWQRRRPRVLRFPGRHFRRPLIFNGTDALRLTRPLEVRDAGGRGSRAQGLRALLPMVFLRHHGVHRPLIIESGLQSLISERIRKARDLLEAAMDLRIVGLPLICLSIIGIGLILLVGLRNVFETPRHDRVLVLLRRPVDHDVLERLQRADVVLLTLPAILVLPDLPLQ